MIEADIEHEHRLAEEILANNSFLDSVPQPRELLGKGKRGKLVTFERFEYEYWPHFNQRLTYNLCSCFQIQYFLLTDIYIDPTLVFNEIMGVLHFSL